MFIFLYGYWANLGLHPFKKILIYVFAENIFFLDLDPQI